jgi:PKD repeat protein
MKPGFLVLTLIILLFFIPVASAQDLLISQPSVHETNLAEMRDFYVYGIFPETVGKPGDIMIELFPGDSATGTPVRVIKSLVDPVTGITNESVIDTTYANATRKNNVMVPDLVKTPGSLLDPSNKVVVTNSYYMGLILGGVTKNFDTSYSDRNGVPLTDLAAGNYTIRVTGLSGDLAGQVATKTVTFGITNAVLGSFRNIPNKNAIIRYAITNNRRTYFDWFPGYFTDPYDSSRWYEAPGRWKPNNGIEIVNDRPGTIIDTPQVANNTMFVYNINNGSTTYRIELAAILRYNLQDTANTTFLTYDIGEPSITYNDADTGIIRTIAGIPVPFLPSSRLNLARVEVITRTNISYENLYDPFDASTPKNLDFDMSDGLTLTSGKEFIIYGATKPIASTVSSTGTPYEYSINNRFTLITCMITDSQGGIVSTTRHDVNLSRLYTQGSETRFNSLWEFGIDVKGLSTPGIYTISLTGSDVSGTVVPGTTASFTVTVLPVADFSGIPVTGSAPLTVHFTAMSKDPNTSYAWDFTNNGTTGSILQNPDYTYTNAGTYSVRLNVTGPDGSGTLVRTNYITVSPAPKPALLADFIVSPTYGTAPLTVQCTDKSTGKPGMYVYNFGDGVTMTGPDPVHRYRYPGIYTITLTITKFNATSNSVMSSVATKTGIITVAHVPVEPLVALFTASPVTGKAPLTVTFTDMSTGNPVFVNYDFGDGTNSTSHNPVHTYRFPGVYTVTLTVLKQDVSTGLVVSNLSVREDLITISER